ncbi:flagellar basal-body rod protein FlgF [Acuticoccus kandeliae]|uniref:flagellar basal-body rod protein FlgF n=1 Tax=Acuticoccus kandeliae TaxID=2073160 RepID=UPI001FE5183B|nr:flagellar basal-body rod protein FlgF [Acuticoccus kandeliae]
MSSDIYVSLSGQIAMDTRLATVANNVANMRTGGFRAELVTFDTVLSDYRRDQVAFAAVDTVTIDRTPGPIEVTGNPLDVAIVGDGWFGVATPSGLAYTRDGRFTISPEGDLQTLTGYGVADEGGAPIQVQPADGPLAIGGDGTITQSGRVVGVLGLFSIAPEAGLTRYGDSAVLSDRPAEPIADRVANGVRQGYREGSNVNAVQSITELIEIQRAFERADSAAKDRYASLEQAVRILGSE